MYSIFKMIDMIEKVEANNGVSIVSDFKQTEP